MRRIVCSLAIMSVLLNPICEGATNSSLSADSRQKLTQLEQRYFEHGFESDPDEVRTARLEELIFGEFLTGDLQNRLTSIIGAASPAPALAPQKLQAQSPQSSNPADSGDDSTDEPISYPHVTLMETSILGKTFAGQPLPQRLARLETKAFGAASTSKDLSQRTDALDQYCDRAFPKPAKKNVAAQTADPNTDPDDSDATENYPRITALEKAILGETFSAETVPSRISRMETKAFGKPSASPDLSQRSDALEEYATKKLHRKVLREHGDAGGDSQYTSSAGDSPPDGAYPARRQSQSEQRQAPDRKAQIMSAVGNQLLGMALGPAAMLVPGFGGVQMRPRQDSSDQDSAGGATAVHHEDPVVYGAVPPPPSAKLITKVGWCEMQVMGRTFPELHLTERLSQLNRQVAFDPSAHSTLELMDHITGLVNAVQARKQRSAGSVPNPTN